MEISWFQIVAQMVNFFILLFLLNKLFYKPVGAAMRAREALLAERVSEAEQLKAGAEEQAAELSTELAQIDQTRERMLGETRVEAKQQYDQLMEKHRREADGKRAELLRQVEQEQETYLREVRMTMGDAAVRLASSVLKSLSGDDLEHRIFNLFLERIGEIGPEDVAGEDFDREEEATVSSHTTLTTEERQAIEERLEQALGYLPRLSYQADDSLMLGYELRFSTLLVQKNMARYLDEVTKTLREDLGRRS